ncbi:MAG: hypothetical protein U0R80_17260 [Nocardioidaceae bacterium]
MLVPRPVLDRVVAGEVDLVFRLWKRPTVKAGGRLRTSVGELAIHEVDVVDPESLGVEDARRAGYDDLAALLASVAPDRRTSSARARVARPDETSRVFRVRVSYAGADARAALREELPTRAEVAPLVARLEAMDARADRPWAVASLDLISRWPGRRAPELAAMLDRETLPWKAQVRRLKELGLTESLPVGYRLSPRGKRVLAAVRRRR